MTISYYMYSVYLLHHRTLGFVTSQNNFCMTWYYYTTNTIINYNLNAMHARTNAKSDNPRKWHKPYWYFVKVK